MMEFMVFLNCAAHDAQNALKWSLHDCFNDKDLLRNCFIATASIRQSFDILGENLAEWLSLHLSFHDAFTTADATTWQCAWQMLGLNEALIRDLLALSLVFSEGRLWVNADHLHRLEVVGIPAAGYRADM